MSDVLSSSPQLLRVRVGCEFVYESPAPTPMLMIVRAREKYNHRLLAERRWISPATPVHEYQDVSGNTIWRLVAPEGTLRVRYDALAEVPGSPDPKLLDMPKTPVEELPDDVVFYTLPSRHCPSDLFIDDAWRLFGDYQGGWAQAQAICDWLHQNVVYGKGSTSNTSGYETYLQRQGVCRDFAHMGVSFCRALNIPARYVCGYLPDINVPIDPTPMDFHAWFEAYIGGAWRTFDARHNRPRTGRVLIATGRDAVDVAMTTAYGGSRLISMQVWADQVHEDLVLDDGPNNAYTAF